MAMLVITRWYNQPGITSQELGLMIAAWGCEFWVFFGCHGGKQCHKPPIWEWFIYIYYITIYHLYTTYIPPIYGEIGDGLWHCFANIKPWYQPTSWQKSCRVRLVPIRISARIANRGSRVSRSIVIEILLRVFHIQHHRLRIAGDEAMFSEPK